MNHCILSQSPLKSCQRHWQSGEASRCPAELVNKDTSKKVVNGGSYDGGWTCRIKKNGFISGRRSARFLDPKPCRSQHVIAGPTKSSWTAVPTANSTLLASSRWSKESEALRLRSKR